ncbi:hypothetical protein M9458_052561, partial [Cirrhinus mrigala]
MLRNAKLLHAFAFLNGSQWDEKWYRLEESPLQRRLHDDYREEKKYARIKAANERLKDAAAIMSTQSHVLLEDSNLRIRGFDGRRRVSRSCLV